MENNLGIKKEHLIKMKLQKKLGALSYREVMVMQITMKEMEE